MALKSIIRNGGTDAGIMARHRQNYPQLVEYLENVRCYSRQTVMEVCRTVDELRAFGYDDARISESDTYELAEIIRNGQTVGKGWAKGTRACINKFNDYFKYATEHGISTTANASAQI